MLGLCCLTAPLRAVGEESGAQAIPFPPSGWVSVDDDAEDDDHILTIPGLGRFPLPPQAYVAHPPKQKFPARVPDMKPEPPARPPLTASERADELFASLGKAGDAEEAGRATLALQRLWSASGSDTIDLLAARASIAQGAGRIGETRDLLDAVVLLRPSYAEGFARRARLRQSQNDVAGALQDYEMSLHLDPRRFDVMTTLGSLLEQLGDKKRALDLYRRSLALSPQQAELRSCEERLRLEVEGRDL